MGILEAQEIAERNKRGLSITEIEEELKALEERKKELQALYASKCDDVIKEAIEKSAQEKKLKRLGKNCFIINVSELMGNPWNVEFHDWKVAKNVLMAYLEKKPTSKWRTEIESLIASAKGNSIYIECGCGNYKYKTPIALEFVKCVLKKIS